MSEPAALQIEQAAFLGAFGRDVDFHDAYPRIAYLHRVYGEICWVYENPEQLYWESGEDPEDNMRLADIIRNHPGDYIEIEGLSHAEHHDILQEFIESDWTADKSAKVVAASAYNRSIGRWIKAVDPEVATAYYEFRDKRTLELGEQFLRKRGIEPEWI